MTEENNVVETDDTNTETEVKVQPDFSQLPEAMQPLAQQAWEAQNAPPERARVGVVGFSSSDFDADRAKVLLEGCLTTLEAMDPGNCDLVSGLTDMGVPGIAYQVATNLKWRTVGYACEKANEHPCFEVDEKNIVGSEWGDESETFLANIDVLVKVGGGPQSQKEFEAFEGPKWELPL